MSFKAILIVDEKEVNVLNYNIDFNQASDVTGRPYQKPVFKGLKLKIETRKDLNFAEWSFAPNQTKQLELHIRPNILGGRTRKIYFYDAHLVFWQNNFSSTGNQPMSETLEIKAAGIEESTSSSVYSAYWRTTFPQKESEPTTISENNEKEVTSYYLTDLEGNELDEYEVGDKIILHIETKNRIGDKITIHLEDKTHDFMYKEKVLEDDKLKNYAINEDLEKIELEVISQSS